jgi:hypothetical protein
VSDFQIKKFVKEEGKYIKNYGKFREKIKKHSITNSNAENKILLNK